MPPGEPEVVQHICLAFVTATLYLLVQPRPPKIEEVTLMTTFIFDPIFGWILDYKIIFPSSYNDY